MTKRYAVRRAKPRLSQWCATRVYVYEEFVPGKRGRKAIRLALLREVDAASTHRRPRVPGRVEPPFSLGERGQEFVRLSDC